MPDPSDIVFGGLVTGPATSPDFSGGLWLPLVGLPDVGGLPDIGLSALSLSLGGGQAAAPQAQLVTPNFDPKLDANALYGKRMCLFSGGAARIGCSPAPLVGPYFNGDKVDFIVSFGVPANVEGDRKIYKIYFDGELAWSSASGGTLPADGSFAAEPFDFVFKPGTLTQTVCSLETEKFPGDEIAYRPQMILEIRNLLFARFVEKTGKPVPYVACDIADVTDGADPAEGINLGEALTRCALSPWAGYTPDTFKSVGITDIVDAILIKDNFTVVELCQSVAGEYHNIDVLVSDKTRVKDRGSNVGADFIFDRDTIIADDLPVSLTRAAATAQRREHELLAIDPDQDYTAVPSLSQIPRNPMVISAAVGKDTATLPLVIDASTRQALATFSQNYEENARRRVALKVRATGYEIEPGDLFALINIADGFDNEVFKVTQTVHGANWVVELEGEAILRCSIYSQTFISATWDPTTVTNVILSGGNLIATNTGTTSHDQGARVAQAQSDGKYYFELTGGATTALGFNRAWGIGTPTSTYTAMGDSAVTGCMFYHANGEVWSNGTFSGVDIGPGSGTIGIAVDLDNRKIWFRQVELGGNWNDNAGYNPASNTGGVTIPAGDMVPFCTYGNGIIATSGIIYTANFGASFFLGSVPSGFTPGWPAS